MPLTAGARLGPYEVHSLLGVGGMGEVYRARDSRLKREVALKVLPDEFADDPDRLARFQREAELLASITHPNIAGLYGLEESTDGTAIVLELVEGETLAERIRRGPLTMDEALAIARQIADGLEAAHERGVIHRDLKPANIKVTPDGQVKILDFGLAKLLEQSPSSASLAMSPTLSLHATAAGVILGTAAYMSPEQARGRALDRRTDVWAFGCVVFEMFVGKRAFEADDSVPDIVAAILKNDLDWAALPADTPLQIRTLLKRCVQKDRQKRLPHIGLARIEIDEVLLGSSGEGVAAATAPGTSRWRALLPWALALVAVASAVVAIVYASRAAAPASATLRLSTDLGADASLVGGLGPSVVLSPDGTLLAFVAQTRAGESSTLYVRRLDQLHASPLAGTGDATSPFFSPDGRWIAFFADGKLRKISVAGGAVATICEAPAGRGGSWVEDDTIIFSPANTEGVRLMRVSSGGGRPEPITTLAPGEFSHRWPQVLPGGKAVLYSANVPGLSFENASIVVQPLPSGPRTVVRRDAYFGRLLPNGHLVYVQGGTLYAAPFDVSRFELTAQPVPVVEGVASHAGSGGVQFSVSDTGTVVYVSGPSIGGAAGMTWMERSGLTGYVRRTRSEWSAPQFAPDGTRLVLDILENQQTDLWIYEWATDALSRLTFDPSDDVMPLWTPTGERISFASKRGDKSTFNLYWQRADGSGPVQRLTDSKNPQIPSSWHPGGRFLAFHERNAQSGWDVMLLPIAGSQALGWKAGTPTPFLNGLVDETAAMFSPDGHWVAYESTETGRREVYVRPFPAADRKWLISAGGHDAVWSRTSKELFYIAVDGRIMVVSYTTSRDVFRSSRPEVWSQAAVAGRPRYRSYDLHPDGHRFVVPEGSRPMTPDRAVFVFNFVEELRRIAPAGKQ